MNILSNFNYNHPKLDNIVHICDENWHGIRNAANFAPGIKFLISFSNSNIEKPLQNIIDLIDNNNSSILFFHGLSPVAELIAKRLKSLRKNIKINFVGHVNSTQFINEIEVDMINRAIEMKKNKIFSNLFSVKPNFFMVSNYFEKQILYNFPPNIQKRKKTSNNLLSNYVFIPLSHGDWRKNVDTNVIAARIMNLDTIIIKSPQYLVHTKNHNIIETGFLNKDNLFNLYRDTKFCLSITISECQPMTQLEAIANGADIFTGPLNLEDTNTGYEKIFEIKCPDNLKEISQKIETYLSQKSFEDMRNAYFKKRLDWAFESYLNIL